MMFTDSYGEQSCTAGRSSFITGQSVYRTGLSKVGIPAAPIGMEEHIVTFAACLKNQGYATGQFGKNHLGDLNRMLPTNHGFDEFFGNLYHLNAEEEPERPDYPSEKEFPNFRNRFGPRGVIHSWATETGHRRFSCGAQAEACSPGHQTKQHHGEPGGGRRCERKNHRPGTGQDAQ
jgi:arylsulfatase A-like enzyme